MRGWRQHSTVPNHINAIVEGGQPKTLLLDPCKACWIPVVRTPATGKSTQVRVFFQSSVLCVYKKAQNHYIVDQNLCFRVAFIHFVVRLISMYYLMAMLFRVLSKRSSVMIFRFEASSRTSGFV